VGWLSAKAKKILTRGGGAPGKGRGAKSDREREFWGQSQKNVAEEAESPISTEKNTKRGQKGQLGKKKPLGGTGQHDCQAEALSYEERGLEGRGIRPPRRTRGVCKRKRIEKRNRDEANARFREGRFQLTRIRRPTFNIKRKTAEKRGTDKTIV